MLRGAAQAAGLSSSQPLAFTAGASRCLLSQPLLPPGSRLPRAPDSPQRSRRSRGSRLCAPSLPVWAHVPSAPQRSRIPLPPSAPEVPLPGPLQRSVAACPPARTTSAFSVRCTSARLSARSPEGAMRSPRRAQSSPLMLLLLLGLLILLPSSGDTAVITGACDKDSQCGGGMCCAVSIWIRSLRMCTPMGNVGDSCHPLTRKVPFFGKRMHHTCPCLSGLACVRTTFNRFRCLPRK
ncbi:prokineticin-2 [Trichosurus vulpecula]|uniref:prokineticin-2 n=1 Tax=Trichosurus vulpecula TaxID=9337 RepID=UPI00186B2692|nr:prokineticin-2 [Trichosurus vulpecula]